MTLTASGQITLSDIAGEFGGIAPHALSEYYDKGNAPSSGEIQLAADFYGTSTTWADAKSLDFDGTDDYLNCTSDSAVDNIWSSGGTFSAWINPTGVGEGNAGRIFNKNHHFLVYDASGSTMKLYYTFMDVGPGTNAVGRTSSRCVSADTWQHVCITHTGTISTNPIVYHNANAQGLSNVTTGVGTLDTDAGATLIIGNNPETSRTFAGNIDDVAIWDVVLDATNVTAIYNSGQPFDLSSDSGNYNQSGNLVGYWLMGDGASYPTIPDYSSNSNDGTMTNMAEGDIETEAP